MRSSHAAYLSGVKPSPIVVYIASDVHMLASADGNPNASDGISHSRYFYASGQKMQNFVDDVNKTKPNLVLCLGDLLERYSLANLNLFTSKWNHINGSIQKELILGNHDMAGTTEEGYGANYVNTVVADTFGYGEHEIVAGSKFTQTFVVSNPYYTWRFITIDTNMTNGGHIISETQQFSDSALAYLQEQLLASKETNIVICTHGSPSDDNTSYFEQGDSLSFKTMLESVKNTRPELKLISIAGHKHPTTLKSYPNFSSAFKSYIVPAVVDFTTGYYVVAKLGNGDITFETKNLVYPYPF